MNTEQKKRIVRSSITQAGVPVLFDEIISGGGQINVQDSKSVEYTENGLYHVSPDQGFDAIKKVNITVDVAGGGDDPDPLHYHIGDIVMWDAANNKKVKTARSSYNLEKYPADNFTPIGIIFHVNEDGSARMLALAAMSSTSPDTGSDQSESIPWGGYGFDIPELDNYAGAATIDDHGIVTGSSTSAYMPTYSSILEVPALDGVRYYSANNKPYMPSPYNADSSLNSEFFKQRVADTVFYEWKRQYNGTWYYMYTDKPGDQLDENTKLYGVTLGHNSFVPNYGFPQSGTNYTYLGLITDTTIYDGGVANFATDFTSTGNTGTYGLLANSDMDGAGNTAKILLHQATNYNFDSVTGGDTTHDGVNMYFWTRLNSSDNKTYWFYTTDEVPTAETEIWIIGHQSSSFVNDYGTVNSSNGTSWYKVGTVGDGTHISGGTTSFTDGTFTHNSEGLIKYYWQRYNESDGKTYFLYTNDDPEHITDSTVIYIKGQSPSSFVYDYGTINQFNGSTIYEVGTIGNSSYINGGAEGFLAHFTHPYPTPWKTSPTLLKEGNNPVNYPAACTTWRFYTPGTKQGDWYLPAEGENAIISANFDYMTESLRVVKSLRPDVKVCGLGVNYYWSSTECSSSSSWYCNYYNGFCGNGSYGNGSKFNDDYVRAVSGVAALS